MASVAQQPSTIRPDYNNVELERIVEDVSRLTGESFIIDPRIATKKITMVSSSELPLVALYPAFLSVLRAQGCAAVRIGHVTKIIPDARPRQARNADLTSQGNNTSEQIVTETIELRYLDAARLVAALQPWIPPHGNMTAHPSSNSLIVSDWPGNLPRIRQIIQRIDQPDDENTSLVELQNTTVTEVERTLVGFGLTFGLSLDGQRNTVLISGDPAQRLRVKALIVHLDTPRESGNTRIRYLSYSDAETVAAQVQRQLQDIQQSLVVGTDDEARAPAPKDGQERVIISADATTNALVVTAPPRIMRQLMFVVDKLDVRRDGLR